MQDITHLRPIIEADYLKHYTGRGLTPEQLWGQFVRYAWNGGKWFETDKVVIMHKDLAPGVAEFHCMNAGDGRDITVAVNTLLQQLSVDHFRAVTYYDNPRISEISKYSNFPAEVQRVDKGIDATFQMTFDLKGH
jgi:hypothetical protein